MSIKKIICYLIGHKKYVPMLIENDNYIYIYGCPRCGKPQNILTAIWKTMPPPPTRTKQEAENWRLIREDYFEQVRRNVKRESNTI